MKYAKDLLVLEICQVQSSLLEPKKIVQKQSVWLLIFDFNLAWLVYKFFLEKNAWDIENLYNKIQFLKAKHWLGL